jgi:hypothetical protein
MSNRLLLPGFRSPAPRRFGIRGVLTPLEPGTPHWQFDGATWEEVCASGAGVGAVPCDASPMAGYERFVLAANVDPTGEAGTGTYPEDGFDAFFAYAMIECSMIGGQDYDARATRALELAEDDIVADRLLREVNVHTNALSTTLSPKAALGMALNAWEHGGDPVVLISHNIAQSLDLEVSENGQHLELKTGEKVYVFRDHEGALADVSDDGPGHIILLGDIVGIEGEQATIEVPVTGVDTGTANFNNDKIALSYRPWLVGFVCDAVWYRVQGLDTP